MVKFADELRGINEQAALSFDRRKNPAEYDLKEKQEMLEAVTEAFNAANWNSAIERRLAADDIAQNLYHPMYPRLEIADAAVQHKLPGEFIQELKQEKIEYFETKHDEAGVEALQITVKDMETAQRMVEQSGGMFHVVSTRNLDHYRDQFADALYSSDRHEGAAGLMESSLDDAIRLYNGDVSHVRRWDETLDEKANFWEPATEQEGESDQQQAEGQLEPTDRESAAFGNLQSMDEYTLDHSIRDMLNEKLSHTQEYLTELQVNQHPDAKKPAIELVSEVQDYNDIRIMGAIEDRIMLSTSNLTQMDAVLITTFVLPNTSETSSRRNAALRALPGSGQADGGTRRVGSGRPATAGVVSRAHTLERLRITQGPG